MSTFVAAAMACTEAGSPMSATMIPGPAEPLPDGSRAVSAASLSGLRPATAQRVPVGACSARYSAVSAPVKPVAPKRTTS